MVSGIGTLEATGPEAIAKAPAWRTYQGRRVVVHALDGSYAAKSAPAELRLAERTVEALERLLEPAAERSGGRIDIYLTDPVVGSGESPGRPQGAGSRLPSADSIVRVVQPEAPGEPVVWPLTHLLAARWFSPDLASAASMRHALDGIAGVVAARVGAGPKVQEAHDWVRSELAAGRTVSILSTDDRVPSIESVTSSNPQSAIRNPQLGPTSFVGFLIETYGVKALRQLLAGYDPARRDQSAIAVYNRPLGALEEVWLTKMRRAGAGGVAIRTFVSQLIPLIRPYWLRQLEIFGYMALALGYAMVMPLASKFLLDNIIPSRDFQLLAVFIVALFGLYVFNALISMRRSYANSWLSQRILQGLQERMFTHLQRLGHNFYAHAKVGDVMTRLSSDVHVVQQTMSLLASTTIYMIVSAIVAAIIMFILNPFLALLVIIVVPLFAVSYFTLRSRLQKVSYERQRLGGEVSTSVQENLSAHAVIKAFGMEERALATFRARLAAVFQAQLRLVLVSSMFDMSTSLAQTLGQLLVLGAGGYLVMQGQLTIGTLLAFIGYLPSIFGPVGALAGIGQNVQTASGSMQRVREMLDEPAAVAEKEGAIELPPLSREIRLEEVTFSYDGDRPVLRDLSLIIPAGTHAAIVGPSGSGKSTVVNLLLRFWDPDRGRVLFDGHDLRDVTLGSLRGQIGLVFQDTFVFDTTLRENIALSRPDATDEEIAAAARAAQLDTYIEALPAGYDTVLGERGVRMSGGQRQRLAIARALLRDPRLLVLDEATSALDAHTEREILDTLATLMPGRTTVSITHRLALAATADRIFVLEQGRLVEEGTHAELSRAGGLYQRLYEEQTGYATGAATYRVEVEAARLKTIPLFSSLGPEALAAMATRLLPERFAAGEDVVRQGEVGDKLYIISRGQVEILVNEQRVNTLNEGDYFGEMALLAGEPRNATVRTTMPSELYSLAQADFMGLLERSPEISKAVSATIAERRAALAALSA